VRKLKLKDIKRSYDVVVSLGSWCGVANEMKRHQLRRFSGPFDWITTPSLSVINRLLINRFEGFMEMENMKFVKYSKFLVDSSTENEEVTERETYIIMDTKYNIASYHDFPVIPNQSWTADYPSYKEKLHRRINRFFEKINNSKLTLFIRYNASYSEVAELRSILSRLTKGKFHILNVNPVEGLQTVREINWDIDGVVCIEIPYLPTDKTQWNSQDWDFILNGIKVNK
jgi:Putative papain-like cysteine peptidase (DUF1796)